MNVLVTGAAGLLGSNLLYLMRDRHNMVGVDRNKIHISRTKTVVSSLEDRELLKNVIEQNDIQVLVHCAAMTNVDLCEQYPQRARYINYESVAEIAELCEKHNVKIVFLSSDAVYRGDVSGLHTEEEVPEPVSVYGKTKFAAEKIVLSSPNNLVLRTNMYGFNYRDKDSFSEWIVKQLSQEANLNMFYDCWFSPLLVNTLVELLELALKKNIAGLYNLCATGSISKYEMGCLIKNAFSLNGEINKISMEKFPFIAPRTHNMGMDNSKIQRALGVQIETIEQGVQKYTALWEQGYGKALKEGK